MANEDEVKLSYVKNNITEINKYAPVRNTLKECLKYWAEVQGDKDAFVFVGESDRLAVTWNELYCKVTRVAKAMIKLGVKKNDYIVVYLKDSPEWLYVVYGAMLAGARPIPLYYVDKTWNNVVAVMEKLKTCSIIVVEKTITQNPIEEIQDNVNEGGRVLSKRFPYLQYVIYHELNGNQLQCMLLDDCNDEIELPTLSDDDIVLSTLTSGSTGPPKVISHTHKTLLTNGYYYEGYLKYIRNEQFIIFNDRPFPWAGGYPKNVTHGICRVTCTMANDPSTVNARTKKLIDIINTERCTAVILMPSSIHHFVDVTLPKNWPVKVARLVGPTSNKILPLLGSFTKAFQIGYTSAETRMAFAAFVQRREDYKPHCAGKLVPGINIEAKIVDEDGDTVPLGDRGEIYIRSEYQFHSYVEDPERTKACVTSDGWCRTDNIGMMKEENGDIEVYVYCIKSNIIMTDETKILPSLMEQAIEKMNPDVIKAIIVPVPDDVVHQALCGCVKIKSGCNLNIDDMKKQFERLQMERPADYKAIPKHWMIVDDFPMLRNGKLSRTRLEQIAIKFLKLEGLKASC